MTKEKATESTKYDDYDLLNERIINLMLGLIMIGIAIVIIAVNCFLTFLKVFSPIFIQRIYQITS
jgi:hypothetical protein